MFEHLTLRDVFNVRYRKAYAKRFLTSYQSGLDGTLTKYRECGEYWRIYGSDFTFAVFASSSNFLVALVVLLRLLTVTQPLSYANAHEKIGRIGCRIIWVFSLLVPSVFLILSLSPLVNPTVFAFVYVITLHLFGTVPTLLTIIIYVRLLYTLRQIKPTTTDGSSRRMAKMTHGIVTALIVCNGSGIVTMQYFLILVWQGGSDVFQSDIGVQIIG